MAKRKSLTKKTRFEVFKRDSFTCQYCGQAAPRVILQVDHIHPVSKDGDNDILNLITSCEDCNGGKSDRLLSDDAAVQKQKSQLDELNERREQLEMMVAWREGLRELGDMELNAFASAWSATVPGYSLNESGLLTAKKLILKHGLPNCLDAIQKAVNYLEVNQHGNLEKESIEEAFRKIPGILRTASYPEWKQKLLHIRNTAKMGRGWSYSTAAMLLKKFEEVYHAGESLENLMAVAREGLNFNQLWDVLEDRLKELE